MGFITITSHYYESVHTFFWVFMQKFVFLFLLLIWFFTCNHWWRKAILVPISMLIYQFIILFNDEFLLKDTLKDKFFILPVVAIIVVLLFLVDKKLNFYAQTLDLKTDIEKEIKKAKAEIE